MMRKTITRTLQRSTVTAYRMTKVDGKPTIETLEPVSAWGKLNENDAKKLLAETYGKDCAAMIDEINVVDETYQIDIETFVANAVKVEQTKMPFDEAPEQEEQ